MVGPRDVIRFWIDEVGPKGWYEATDALDAEIRRRFEAIWQQAASDEGLEGWLTNAEGCLAYIILTDQFPRNMFRGADKAFSTDPLARAAAKKAIARDWDLQIAGQARQFFYLPLEHSESQCDQDRAVRLFKTRMPESESGLLHARAHREIIRRFGRFPFRNAALGRRSTKAEESFLASGAYGAIVRALQGNMASA